MLVSTVSYITISNELETRTADQLASTAIKQEQKINSLLQAKQEEVTKLANAFDIQVALAQYLATKKPADAAQLNKLLQNKKVAVPDFQAISIAGLDGNIIASTVDGTLGQKLPGNMQPTSGQDRLTTVSEDSRDGINKLYITVPLAVNKEDSATMSVIFRIDDIIAAVQDYTGLGSTGETIVAEKNNNNQAISLFPLRFDTDAALQSNVDSLKLFDHTNGEAYSGNKDYRNNEVITAARSIGFADWVIATKIDQKEALAPIIQLRNSIVVIFVVSSIAIVVIALYFARFFTEPILRITRTSKQIGQGDFSARIDITRDDEIGALADSINSMGLSLKEFVNHLEAQRNRLAIILNSTEESILAIDKQGVVIIANQAAADLSGYTIEELVGKPLVKIFSWVQNGQVFPIDYSATGSNSYTDLQYTNPAGATHYVKLMMTRLASEQEAQEAQTIITIHDETKSRELENMKIDFVSMAAHELRTPLAAIRGYLELITYKEKERTSAESQKYIGQAMKSTVELGSLINNLLDVTRIERGSLTLSMDSIDLAETIKQAVQDAQFSAKDKNISLAYTGPESGCPARADHLAMQEVANNLIANAIKYTPPNGTVVVTLTSHEESYRVDVRDTGIGIPKQAIGNLFTKFYRVKGGLNSGSTGTGLGLFISKSIIERHHGTISVESEEGKGSTFTFILPRTQPDISEGQDAHVTMTRRNRGWTTQNITR